MLAGMFRAPEFSKHDDMEDFERDGLLLVSKLIPTLTDQNTAPSDAVAYFLRRMEGILRKHTLGTDNRHTWLRFVAINTVFDQTGDTYTPRFHIFPHKDTSGEKAINAFLLSHPKRRATVKLMIFLWARARNSEVSDEFKQLFEDYEHGEVVYDAENQCTYFSEHDDPELWDQGNLDISPHGQKTRCTLGPVDSYRSQMMAPTRNSMAM